MYKHAFTTDIHADTDANKLTQAYKPTNTL